MQSKPYWPQLVVPPKGAPNVLLIMTGDVSFSAPSTFGGVIPTPALDRVAQLGLRYTRFHTTALCSPTRAALLTGRNHHSAATGVVVDQATGYPGYNSVIPRDTVAVGEILRQNGYDTSWYGKDHNVPQWEGSQAGPFHNWPTGPVKGFDHYYGFLCDDASQWQPGNLFRNTTPIEPFLGKPGWNLITAMADEAIQRVRMMNELQPDRPFMIYYAPGGTHAPHHPTKEWVDKIAKMNLFAEGWNKQRERIFANQKKLGIVPQNARLTEWPKDLAQWDTLSAEAKRLYTRQANVYAAYLAYTDHEIGRVIQAVEDAGKLDNTLVIYISGDNGASPEGTTHGLYSEYAVANGVHPSVDLNMKFYDAWGSDQTYPHFAVAWGLAWDTPYQYTSGEISNVPFPGYAGAPPVLNRSYTFTVEIEVPQGGAEGMLVTDGGRFGGYGFYLVKGRPVFTWNLLELERVKWQGKEALAPGKHTLEFDWKYDGPGPGKGGTGMLKVNGTVVDSHPMARSLPLVLPWDETFNVGLDTGTPVDDKDYQVPFRFTGRIGKLTVKLGPNEL